MNQPIEITPEQLEKLKQTSRAACQFSYSPYSKFKVGAALLTIEGKFFSGCNVENSSYGLAICAERTAFVKAVSEGYRKFSAIAIYSDTLENDFISPCGACRQFMAEFGLDWEVFMLKKDFTYRKGTVRELLPYAFEPSQLEGTPK